MIHTIPHMAHASNQRGYHYKVLLFAVSLLTVLLSTDVRAQFNPNCTGGVPTYNVNFSGNVTGTFEILNQVRQGNCCGTSSPDRCLRINITPDTGAAAVLFEVTAGSLSPGSLFYQINCGTPTVVGQAACVSGASVLTFCKPGNNTNSYRVTSIPRPTFPKDDTVRQNCSDTIVLLGFRRDSIRITSIFPGTRGQYNSYLSCTTGCDRPIFTAGPGAPQYVEYEVCGYPFADQCSFSSTLCSTFKVFVRPQLSVSVTPSPAAFCPTSPTIALTASAVGGVGPFTYTWYNGSTIVSSNSTYNASTVGTYTVSVNDAFASQCPAVTTVVPVSYQNLDVVPQVTDVSCFGSNNGILEAATTGGSAPYSYSWTGGGTTQVINGLAPGSYTVTVTDFTGCTTSSSATITQPTLLAIPGSTITQVGCNGESTGAVDVNISGGTPPYTFLWSNGAVTEDISAVPAGLYDLTVTDSLGCTATYQARVDEPAAINPLVSGYFDFTNVSCYGGSNGTATITVTGGTPPFNYIWSNGAVDSSITGLAAGPYEVSIIDQNGCSSIANLTITQPDSLYSVVQNLSTYNGLYNISCFGASDGSIDVEIYGGTAPYAYAWSNGDINQDLNNIPAGTYDLTVTDTLGCTTTVSVILTQPDSLVVSLFSPVYGNNFNIACKGENSGRIFSTVTGGTAPYGYSWSPGGATTDSLTDLFAGPYLLDIVDANGCLAFDTITLTEPDTVVPLISSATIGFSNIDCYGAATGTASVTVVGGTRPYVYQWSNGSTDSTAAGLSAGVVSVYVVDANGCTGDTSETLTQPTLLQPSVSATDALCNGTPTGQAISNTNGGTPPYTYLWSNGLTTAAISNVTAGTYDVTVTDHNGCVQTGTAVISEPQTLTVTDSVSNYALGNISCNGANNGTINLTVNGGTPTYSYSWNNGATTGNVNSLAPGTYSVTVTDANGCTATVSATLTEPTPLVVTSVFSPEFWGGVNVSCNAGTDGEVHAVVSGGSPQYTFSWTNGGTDSVITNVSVDTFVVTVTDANGCTATGAIRLTEPTPLYAAPASTPTNVDCYGNSTGSVTITTSQPPGGPTSTPPYQYSLDGGQTFQSDSVISGLAVGNYNITVRDSNGCSVIVGVSIQQPSAALVVDGVSSIAPLCYGNSNGSLTATVSGGTTPYQYSIDNNNFQSSNQFTGLPDGSYTVTVLDANQCTASLNLTLDNPPVLDLATNSGSVSANCFVSNGTAFVAPSGGVPPYTYNWAINSSNNDSLINVPRGDYTVIVRDQNNCIDSIIITVSELLCDFDMPNGLSPNGDGDNDVYLVRGADKYPNNVFKVFNRWGNEVYSKDNYVEPAWRGENNSGDPLPEGTYFAVFAATDSDFKASAFVDIRR